MLSRLACQKNALSLRLPVRLRVSPSLATFRPHSSSTRSTPLVNSSTSQPQHRLRRPSFQSSRNLATATDQSAIDQGSYGSFDKPHPWATLPNPAEKLDPSSLVIVRDFLETKPRVLQRKRGIGGDEEEMMINLDVSLKVGHFERAASLITRLGEFHPIGSPEHLSLHNWYLEEMVQHMTVTRQQNLVLPMQRWFEVDMVSAGCKPDATTYAIMLRMALRMLHGPKRDRTVRRYWEFAKKEQVEEDVLAVPILSALELGELSEICTSDLRRVAIGNFASEPAVDNQQQAVESDVVPDVRSVAQRGFGLSSLQESLSVFSNGSTVALPTEAGNTPEESKEMFNQLRQRQVEADSIRSAIERWRKEVLSRQQMGLDMTAGGKKLGSIMNQWHSGLVAKIHEELKMIEEAEANPVRTVTQKERLDYGVFVRSLDPERLAALTILAVIGAFSRGGMEKGLKLSAIATNIGKDLQDELIAEKTLLKHKQQGNEAWRMKALKEILADRKGKGRSQWHGMVHRFQEEDPTSIWPPRVRARVGAVLMSLLFESAKVPVYHENPNTKKTEATMEAAFHHAYQITWGKRIGLIHLNPEVVQIVAREPTADLLGRQLPMICKPKPWQGPGDGGYFLYRSNIVRTTPGESLQPTYIKAALQDNGLEQIRAGLDILGSTGWNVNRQVFDVMLEAWNSGEAIANLAPLEPDFQPPPKPAPEEGYEAERKWNTAMREYENMRGGLHSVRCFQNFQMEVARAYRNETFYLPHNMDFRGRAYPLPPYLNQMGADNARGLLLFSEAKPLRENGLKWLKVQIANLAGYDKASLSEREKFTMDHLDDICDSADNGLHGRRWWLKAEDPWQCLAACCELRNAMKLDDPASYMSRLPIHQDGSCNGLQHYAALGGDQIGAEQVNLEPSDRPSDVYTGVAEFVREAVAREAAQGDPTARLLDGKITRKVVKQTVMTNVYGVTFIGAMKQVRKQLVDHYPEFTPEEKKFGALYIARKIFEALGSMFNGAHEIQYWLGDCASRITQSLTPEQIDQIARDALTPTKTSASSASSDPRSKASQFNDKFKSTVIWTTPLGMPVVQPYRTRKVRRIYTSLQNLSLVDHSSEDAVSRRKQLQAFPPNFIHSLDATHMMLSAIACHQAGLTFSAVHDSFWTHAGDVDDMNKILRDAFVRMHSDDVVKRLAAEFNVRYGQNLFYARIKATNPIAKAIEAARKERGLKNGRTHELLEERQRQQLLQSDDPELQAQGRAMVTPASIFEQAGGTDDDMVISRSLGETVVGHVPENVEAAERRPADADGSDPAIQSLTNDFEEDLVSKHEADATVDTVEDVEEKPKRRYGVRTTWLWMPMSFREVPQKGAWDITRIRDSKYFFS